MSRERTKEFPLEFDVAYKGETLHEITLRRPTMKEAEELSQSKDGVVTASMQTVADLAGKPLDLIRAIDPEDYAPMQKWAQSILEKLSPA